MDRSIVDFSTKLIDFLSKVAEKRIEIFFIFFCFHLDKKSSNQLSIRKRPPFDDVISSRRWRHNFPGFDVLGFGPKDSKNSYNHFLSWRNFVRVSFFQLFVLCYRNISWSDRIDGDPARHENQGCKIKCTECLAGLEGFDCCTETRRQHSGKHRRATTTTSRPTLDQNYCSRPEIQPISCCAKGLEHTMSFFSCAKIFQILLFYPDEFVFTTIQTNWGSESQNGLFRTREKLL